MSPLLLAFEFRELPTNYGKLSPSRERATFNIFSIHFSGYCRQVEERKTPLTTALGVVIAYADAWGPRGFPVPADEQAAILEVDDGTTDGCSVSSRQPPNPLLLHRAVWAQAEILAKRCRLLFTVGEGLSTAVERKIGLVRLPSETSLRLGTAHSVILCCFDGNLTQNRCCCTYTDHTSSN